MNGSYPQKFLNLRNWNPEEEPDLDLLDDEDTEREYWQATDEAIEAMRERE